MKRSGRKRKAGDRFPGGKLRALFDRGTERVTENRARFTRFHDGKAEQQVFDPIGRAWAVGLLENDLVDPAALRDAGRNYASRYWGYYPSVVGVANYESDNRRGHSGGGADPCGEQFQRLDAMLRSAGRNAYDAAQSLCLDFYWFPDDDPLWLGRLINEKMLRARLPVVGFLPRRGDHAMIDLAVEGLLAITATSSRMAA
jgi:hypothetical protein